MRTPVKPSSLAQIGALFVLMASFLSAQSSVVFVADDLGNVVRFMDGQTNGTALGSLSGSGFSASQVLGIAYDSNTNAVLLFDCAAHTVYSMNAASGIATVLFTTDLKIFFQGGAVFNNLVYGIDEDTQKILAYSFDGSNRA